MRPPAELLERLKTFRLLAGKSGLSMRPGERRSTAKGAGIEFAGSRPYREGDDLRHLDSRLYARYRKPYLREHLADRQLRVALLIDTSASMDFGTPAKRDFALVLAGLFGCAALSSGDLVEIGLAEGKRMNWSDALQGSTRADVLLRWIEDDHERGSEPFPNQIGAALQRLRASNLAILISDWWLDSPAQALRMLGELPGAVIAVHVTSPEEENPLLLGRGPMRLQDAESGAELALSIDPSSAADYAKLLKQHKDAVRAEIERLGGRYIALRSDMSATEAFSALVHENLLGQNGTTRGGRERQGPGVPI